MDGHDLKRLQTREHELELLHREAKAKVAAALEESGNYSRELKRIKAEIYKLRQESKKNLQVVVSEHALVRYFERHEGYDLAAVRKAIVPPEVEVQIAKLGDGHYPVGQSHRVRVKNGVVCTLTTSELAYASNHQE